MDYPHDLLVLPCLELPSQILSRKTYICLLVTLIRYVAAERPPTASETFETVTVTKQPTAISETFEPVTVAKTFTASSEPESDAASSDATSELALTKGSRGVSLPLIGSDTVRQQFRLREQARDMQRQTLDLESDLDRIHYSRIRKPKTANKRSTLVLNTFFYNSLFKKQEEQLTLTRKTLKQTSGLQTNEKEKLQSNFFFYIFSMPTLLFPSLSKGWNYNKKF